MAPAQLVATKRGLELGRDPSHVPQARRVVAGDPGSLGVLLPPLHVPVPDPVPNPPLTTAPDHPQLAPRGQPLLSIHLIPRSPSDRGNIRGGRQARLGLDISCLAWHSEIPMTGCRARAVANIIVFLPG